MRGDVAENGMMQPKQDCSFWDACPGEAPGIGQRTSWRLALQSAVCGGSRLYHLHSSVMWLVIHACVQEDEADLTTSSCLHLQR